MLRPLLLASLLCVPGFAARAAAPAWHFVSHTAAPPVTNTEDPKTTTPTATQTPVVVNSLPDIAYSLTAGSFTINLTEVFEDTDGGALSFSAISNNRNVATTEVAGNILTVTPLSLGSCRIRATARDNDNGKADDTFTLIINSNQPPSFAPEAEFNKQVLVSNAEPTAIDLSGLFIDPDGDNLVYAAESEDNEIATVEINDETLQLNPGQPGETRISLSANDQNGGILLATFAVEVILGYPATMAVDIGITFGDYRDQGNYRLLALPGNQSIFLGNLIEGDANKDWVAYAPDTSNTGRLVPFERSPSFVLNPGSGLWLLSKSDWEQREVIVETVPLTSEGVFEIPLRAGWNIISNPLDQNIPWSIVAAYNGVSQDIWRWKQGYRVVNTFYSTLNEAEAFYFNNVEGLESLKLPYSFQTAAASKSETRYGQQATGIQQPAIILEATHGPSSASAGVQIVHAPEAEDGFDGRDKYAPPVYFDAFSLLIAPAHPDFAQQKLAVEARSTSNEAQLYDLELTAPEAGPVTLQLSGTFDEDVVLVNRLDTQHYRLKDDPLPTLHLEEQVTPFTLLVGGRDAVEEALRSLKPSIYSLKPNYPNPFGSRTTIEYALPEAQHVDLRVFDLMGRHVTTLYQGEQAAGLHRVQWHGLDQHQHPVANGVYFYRLQSQTWTHTRKMTLIR
ncbi:MAG: FlgD immunoglobulin-like domain containing protein [Bacteroidota bacterium]